MAVVVVEVVTMSVSVLVFSSVDGGGGSTVQGCSNGHRSKCSRTAAVAVVAAAVAVPVILSQCSIAIR